MPFQSEKQRKAMYAAASGKSNLGISKAVAKKFIKHDQIKPALITPEFKDELKGVSDTIQQLMNDVSGMKHTEIPEVPSVPVEPEVVMPVDKDAGAAGRAAGIMFLTNEGEMLFIRRGKGGDFPGTWCIPGGHQNGEETLEDCARRECEEETGIKYDGALETLFDDGQFCYYIARNAVKTDVKLNYESTGYDWCEEPPLPMHPGLEVAIRVAKSVTEHDKAELMREDVLASPQMFANVMLLAIRITGTGMAFRSSIGEFVWRDPSLYLNDEFLKRCNGLIVVQDHPESKVLTSEEFKNRAVGSVILPYIKGDEVWGIAKIYDEECIKEILEGEISTSPSVVFDNSAGNVTLTTEEGNPLLIEGKPFLLDHIAIVTKARGSRGVWDKGGEPAGVLLNNQEVSDMSEKIEPKADADGKLDAILTALSGVVTKVDGLVARVDEMEKNLPAEPLPTAADDDEDDKKDDDSRKDDDEEEEVEVPRKDAKKHRKDAVGGEVEAPAGEIKPDDDDEEEEAKHDDDDDDAKAKKADDELAEYADCQAKADSVYAGFGKSASRPLVGESLMSYRKRLLRGLQAYSDEYKGINLNDIKGNALLNIAEKRIFADAVAASKGVGAVANGLVEIHERDRSGRVITKFRGAMSSWLDEFKIPVSRGSINVNSNRR